MSTKVTEPLVNTDEEFWFTWEKPHIFRVVKIVMTCEIDCLMETLIITAVDAVEQLLRSSY